MTDELEIEQWPVAGVAGYLGLNNLNVRFFFFPYVHKLYSQTLLLSISSVVRLSVRNSNTVRIVAHIPSTFLASHV